MSAAFSDQLKPHVERMGTAGAARVCGVTQRTVQLWMVGCGNPNASTRAGAILLLECWRDGAEQAQTPILSK